MKQVPGLDALFLHLETPEMPMHVGALHLFELPQGFRGHWVNALRKHLQTRLPHAPALRKQLAELPLNLVNPVWVDVMPDLRLHVVPHVLPTGATLAALHAEVARLHCELLPRDRPLWRMHVFEDIAPGDNGRKRVALYTQLHHAAVDGQAAVALAEVLLDLTPEPRELPAVGTKRRKSLQPMSAVDQWRMALSDQARQFMDLARAIPSSAGTLTQLAGGAAGSALTSTAKSVLARFKGAKTKVSEERHGMLSLAPRTRFNVAVSSTRSFTSLSLPLPALQAARKALGASLNDAVLFLCASALRELLKAQGELPRKSLIAAVPVSMREAGDSSGGNQVTMSSLSLGTHIADPKKRFKHILARHHHDEAIARRTQKPDADRLPEHRPALAPEHRRACLGRRGGAHSAHRQPRHLQRARPTGGAVPGRCAHADECTGEHRGAWDCAEHYGSDV